jgi:(p)ppGpp synthase/HD superfamily hydrolase
MNSDHVLILKALRLAAVAHVRQTRKDDDHTPYISHPAMVGMILREHGAQAPTVAAGILHDVIEDTKYGYDELARACSSEVADLVLWVTENNQLPFIERKAEYLHKLAQAPTEALMISAADLLANRLDGLLAMDRGEDLWGKFHWGPKENFIYDEKRLKIISEKLGDKHALVKQLQTAITDLLKHTETT